MSSSIVISDGNIVVFVNDLKNGIYQEYAQKLSTKGDLIGTNTAILAGISSSIASKFLKNTDGNLFAVLFLLDVADANGYFSYLAMFKNDLTNYGSPKNYIKKFVLEREICLFQSQYAFLVSSEIILSAQIEINYQGTSDFSNLGTKSLSFNTFQSFTDMNTIPLKNNPNLIAIILSVLDSGYNSYYLLMKVFDFSSVTSDDFNTGNVLIDPTSPANGIKHLYSQLAVETSSGNVVIAYQSTGQTLSSNSAVKYAVLNPTASTFIKTASFLTDSDSSNIKYPKLACLNNQKCIISWIDIDEKICFQIINSDGTLSGSKRIGPKIEQPTSSKSGSLLQIPNSNYFMYFHSVTATKNVVGWKFNSDCQIYTIENCQGILSADGFSCTPIENCFVYKSDRSACSECKFGYEIDSNLCVSQSILYCKTYTDQTKKACATCDANHFSSETGIICAERISGCNIYSDLGICNVCDPGKVLSNAGFICADKKYSHQMERGNCAECLFPGDRPNMNAFIRAHYLQ